MTRTDRSPPPTTDPDDDDLQSVEQIVSEYFVDFDDIPDPWSGREPSPYEQRVAKAVETGKPYTMTSATFDGARAIRAGVNRAAEKLGVADDIDVIARKHRDGTHAVYIIPVAAVTKKQRR